jgi:hypothetical protein
LELTMPSLAWTSLIGAVPCTVIGHAKCCESLIKEKWSLFRAWFHQRKRNSKK